MKQRSHRKQSADLMASSQNPDPEKLSPLDLAGKLYNKGQISKAHQICLRILTSNPADHKAMLLLAMIERRRGNLTKAIGLATQTIRLKPDYADALINLGIMYHDRHIFSLAKKFIEQGLQIEPDHRLGLLVLANLQQDNKDWPRAEWAMRRLLLLDPSEAEFHYRLGDLLLRQGRHGEAEDAFSSALAIKPNLIKAHFGLSRAHHFSADDPQIDILKNRLADPGLSIKDNILLNFSLGWGFDQIGAYPVAFSHIREANRLQATLNPFDEKEHLRYLSRIRDGYAAIDPRPPTLGKQFLQVPIFIVGPSRSGKTLLESLLTMDKRVIPLGERNDFLLAMDETIARHELRGGFPECLGRLTPDQLDELGSAYRRRVAAIDKNARYFVNTLPGLYKFVGLILEALPEAKVICCGRGALDTCLRIYFTHYNHPHPYSHDQETLARYFAAYWHHLAFWQTRYGERIFRINYEDIVTDPQVTISRTMDFIGMDMPPDLTEYKIPPDEIGHWRHYANELQPMRKTLDALAQDCEIPQRLMLQDPEASPPDRSVLTLDIIAGVRS